MKITRKSETQYFVETGDLTADLRPISGVCVMVGNVMKSQSQPGFLSTVPPIRITLGQTSFASVGALQVGDSVSLNGCSPKNPCPQCEALDGTSDRL